MSRGKLLCRFAKCTRIVSKFNKEQACAEHWPWAKKNPLPAPPKEAPLPQYLRRISPDVKEKVVEELAALPVGRIATKLGVSAATVCKIRNAHRAKTAKPSTSLIEHVIAGEPVLMSPHAVMGAEFIGLKLVVEADRRREGRHLPEETMPKTETAPVSEPKSETVYLDDEITTVKVGRVHLDERYLNREFWI